MYSPLFADISSYNSKFDAAEYRNAGHILVAIKATEGIHYVNPDHRAWCYAAGGKHIGVVHYHFARPDLNDNAANEADHFLEVALPLAGGRDFLVLDLERATPSGWQHDPAWSQIFDSTIRHRSRFNTILYASDSVLRQSDEWLIKAPFRVWDANYSGEPNYAPPGYTCVFRQFTDGVFGPEPHYIPGVGVCDVNRMSAAMFTQVAANAR